LSGGFSVDPAALLAFGAGSRSLGEKFGALAGLLAQARVDDQCFGPIGEAIGIAGKYFESLAECQKLASDAKGFLDATSEQLAEQHATVTGLEDGLAQGFARIGDALGGARG
jgi:hypothetical protein